MIERSLFESIGDSQNIIVSGKGGVGKSTISSAIAQKYATDKENTIAVDIDAAHSLSDSLGYDIGKIPDGTSVIEHSKYLVLYFLGTIIPDFFPGENFETLLETGPNFEQLNDYLDSLLDDSESFLSLLRMGVHDNFVSLAKSHGDVAYILQLLDLFEKGIIHKIEGKERKSYKSKKGYTRRVIDSENTKGLLKVLKSLASVRSSIKNIHASFHGTMTQKVGGMITREAIKRQDNLHSFAKSDMVKNPDGYIDESVNFFLSMTKSKVIIVTAPGYTEVNQAITEVKQLVELGIMPAHVVVNKYRDHLAKDKEKTKRAYQELKDGLQEYDIGVSIVDSDFEMIDYDADEKKKKAISRKNLAAIAEVV